MKKLILVLFCLILMTQLSYASDCTLERKELRGWYNFQCPENSYVIASRTDHIGNFTYTYVRCEEITIKCVEENNVEEESVKR